MGEEYPDGFIDSSRTSLSYEEVSYLEKTLHSTDYVLSLYKEYRERHSNVSLCDARLHYRMIKGIRKHKHVARVLYEKGGPELFPMLITNARNILAGDNNDILDDFPVISPSIMTGWMNIL